MIGAACEAAEKVIFDCRKAYGLGSRQGPTLVPTLDKVQAAKIQEQENVLRAAVNFGEGFKISIDQRQVPTSLPSHLADVLSFGDGAQNLGDNAGSYEKNTSSFSSNQGVLQVITLRTWVMKGLHRLQILFFDLDSFCTERLCLLLRIEWAKVDTFAYYTVKTAFERPLLNGVVYAERVVHSQREIFERETTSEYEFKAFKELMPKNLPCNVQGTTSTLDIIEGTQALSEEQ